MKEMGDMVLIADAFNSCKVIVAMPEGGTSVISAIVAVSFEASHAAILTIGKYL